MFISVTHVAHKSCVCFWVRLCGQTGVDDDSLDLCMCQWVSATQTKNKFVVDFCWSSRMICQPGVPESRAEYELMPEVVLVTLINCAAFLMSAPSLFLAYFLLTRQFGNCLNNFKGIHFLED